MKARTVLVVDDDPCIVAYLTAALELEGYNVLSAMNGAALSVAHDRRPDVILLDLMMPGMDGETVCMHLRRDPVTAAIPIILMSARDHLAAIATRMGVNDRLPKPFRPGDLYDAVARWAGAA